MSTITFGSNAADYFLEILAMLCKDTVAVTISPQHGEPFRAVLVSHDADTLVYESWDEAPGLPADPPLPHHRNPGRELSASRRQDAYSPSEVRRRAQRNITGARCQFQARGRGANHQVASDHRATVFDWCALLFSTGVYNTGDGKSKGRQKRKTKQKRQVPAGPDVQWISRVDWDRYEFTASTVGRVDETGTSVDILLNLDFDKLEEVLTNPRYTTAVIEARKSAYMVPTALGLYRIHQIEQEGELEEAIINRLQGIVADSVLLATDSETLLGDVDQE